MIARIWFGRTRAEQADEYVEYVRRTGVTTQRATTGNLASMILTRRVGDEVEVGVLSLWESLDAIRAFAGERPDVAVYFPEDERFLSELPPEVDHYEVPVAELARSLG